MPESEFVDPSELRPGPICNESLPSELLEHIGAIYEVIGQYLGTTLEQFEISFMRDMNPESEVAIWCSITAAWIAYHERFLSEEILSDDDEKKLISALIAISTGVDDVTKLGVPAEIGRYLLACYDGLSDE